MRTVTGIRRARARHRLRAVSRSRIVHPVGPVDCRADRRNAEVIARHGESLLPVIRTVFDAAAQWSATDYFQYAYRLAALRREVEMIFQDVQVLVVPSAPRPMTVAEVAADPIGRNVQLGAYSYFVNPLDLCAVAIPTGIADGGVPFGITLVGPAFADARLSDIAAAFARHGSVPD